MYNTDPRAVSGFRSSSGGKTLARGPFLSRISSGLSFCHRPTDNPGTWGERKLISCHVSLHDAPDLSDKLRYTWPPADRRMTQTNEYCLHVWHRLLPESEKMTVREHCTSCRTGDQFLRPP